MSESVTEKSGPKNFVFKASRCHRLYGFQCGVNRSNQGTALGVNEPGYRTGWGHQQIDLAGILADVTLATSHQ